MLDVKLSQEELQEVVEYIKLLIELDRKQQGNKIAKS